MKRTQMKPRKGKVWKKLKPRSKKKAGSLANWKKVKIALNERSGGNCERMIPWVHPRTQTHSISACWQRATDPHHILAQSQGGKDALSNLLHLCRSCHRFTLEHPRAAMAEGLVKQFTSTK